MRIAFSSHLKDGHSSRSISFFLSPAPTARRNTLYSSGEESRSSFFAALISFARSISLRYFIDWRGSNCTPSNGNGLGNDNCTCRILFAEYRLRAWRSIELTEIRALRSARGLLPTEHRK